MISCPKTEDILEKSTIELVGAGQKVDITSLLRKGISLRSQFIKIVNAILSNTVNGKIAPLRNLYPWQGDGPAAWDVKLEKEAPDPQSPRLADLKRRYRHFDSRVTTPAVWDEQILSDQDTRNFRGDTQFVWQRADMNLNEIACALSYYYLKSGGAADLLETLTEDGAFGALSLELDGRKVTRDLVDSVGEIDFLRRNTPLGKQHLAVLDIGAGYGRLAHRISEAVGSQCTVFATDAFAASTFLSEYYLAFRETGARVLPLDEVEAALSTTSIDIVTNIHSFSECTLGAIEWWVELLAKTKVRYLMVAPNRKSVDGRRCLTNQGEDMSSIFERFEFTLIASEPRHADPFVQRFGMDPCTFFLYERLGAQATTVG